MVLRIDPRFPLVWRNPHSMQFGIDAPVVVLDAVTGAQERMVAALVSGVSRSGLEMIARSAKAFDGELEQLVDAVAPILESPTPPARLGSVHISGTGRTADQLADILRAAGVELGSDLASFAVVVGHHVIAPELYGRWLRRDIPHLAIVYGDSRVRVGPIVEPGVGPCLYCLDRYRSEADPVWPAIASQLWGRLSPLETPLLAAEVAALAGRLVLSRLTDGAARVAEATVLDATTGGLTRRTWVAHPECGCREVSVGLPETATAPAPANDPILLLPRRGASADGRA